MSLPNITDVFYLDPVANTILPPQLMLTTRSFKPLGLIKYTNWNFSLVANGMDEFTFDVYKPEDITEDMNPKKKLLLTYEKKVWDNLVDLKLILIQDYGRFEISVNYTDNTKTIKSVHARSLECELSEAKLYDFHVNDDEAMATMEVNEYNKDNFDSQGNFIPTTLCNFSDEKHSLIHRVLADKAPHWTVGNQEKGTGYFTPFVTFDEDEDCELSKEFQRTYTCNGESIYEFLTGTVANEANVVFVFDTMNRVINCYSACDCILQHNGELKAPAIGEDTNVFLSKEKLVNEISITSKKDNVKNCFRVEGGDDYINAMVAVANVNGTNYITQFSELQYSDMSEELREVLQKYIEALKAAQPNYEKVYLQLCDALDDLYYKESGMMPQASTDTETAKDQYDIVTSKLTKIGTKLTYTSSDHTGLTNSVESLAQAYVTSNYDVEVIGGSTTYKEGTGEWVGNIKITNTIDKEDIYPKGNNTASVKVLTTDDEIRICEQKIEKALAKGDMISAKFFLDDCHDSNYKVNESKVRSYFDQYALNRLKSFYDAFESCVSILIDMGKNQDQDSADFKFYSMYVTIRDIIGEVKAERQAEVDAAQKKVDKLSKECEDFQKQYNMETWFINYYKNQGDLGKQCYLEYCSYRREDTYSNPNYISDGLSDSECIKKAKELLEVARKEIKKACVLQRTLEIDLNNLLMLEEFRPLWNKFSMYNYVRLETDDEILKLRLIGIDINGSSLSSVNVTFSDQIENIDGAIDDLQSIMEQAKDVSSAFPSTIRQAKQGEEAARVIGSIRKNGLIAAQTLISNADNNEVTYGGFGILCKNQGDSGDYGLKQLRIIGNGIYLTTDAWKTVEMCIGEIMVGDQERYGIIADTIIAGTIIGGDGGTYWNLDTGEFVMSSSSTKVDDGSGNEPTGLNQFIVNTAEGYIEASFNNETGAIGQLKVDAEKLTAEFEDNGRVGKLEATAESLTSEFEDEDGRVSVLEQTVDGIRSEVFNEDGSSKIEQTADYILGEVESKYVSINDFNTQIAAAGGYYFHVRYSPIEATNLETIPDLPDDSYIPDDYYMTKEPIPGTKSVGVKLTSSNNDPVSMRGYNWYSINTPNGYKGTITKTNEDGTTSTIEQYLHLKFSDDGKTFSNNILSTNIEDWLSGRPAYGSGKTIDFEMQTDGNGDYITYKNVISVKSNEEYSILTNHSKMYIFLLAYDSSGKYTSYVATGRASYTYKVPSGVSYLAISMFATGDSDTEPYSTYEELVAAFDAGEIRPAMYKVDNTVGETLGEFVGTYVDETQVDSENFNAYTWQRVSNEKDIRSMKSMIKQTADNILLKVESTNIENGKTIASLINIDSDEVFIRGENIKLEGTVTANESFKVLTDGSAEAANLTVENEISAYTLNVETINNGAYQKTLSSNITMYVDAVNGSDESSCEYNAVFQTLQAAINSIPKFMNGKTVQIELRSDIAENVYVRSFIGGWLEIYLGGYIINGLIRNRCCELVSYYGGTISGNGTDKYGTIHPISGVDYSGYFCSIGYDECGYGYIGNMIIYAPDNSNNKSCIGIQSNGSVTCGDIKIINAEFGFLASLGGHLHINKSSGIAKQYGFVAVKGGVITLSSTYTDSSGKKITHAGGVTNSHTEYHGGTVKFHEQTYFEGKDTSGSQTTDSKPAVKPSTTQTITCKSNSVRSIRNYNKPGEKWRSDTAAKVGQWSSEYGYHAAFWFFGNQFDDALASNATINSIKIKYSRESGGNHSQDVTHYFYGHTHTSQPSDPTKVNVIGTVLNNSSSIKAGESDTVSLSSSVINTFKSNKCKGICCIAPNEKQSSYSVMGGSMTVTIKYTTT